MALNVGSVQSFMENVRALMNADTATLLLLDETGTVLEPAASAGLGRRWRGATHVPVGSGFAGRVAGRREPVVLNEVNEVSVLNPILRDFGVQRLLGVPVFGSKGLLGVLHVGSLTARTFTPDDTRRLEGAAAEIGQRLSERTEDDAHLAALALQRSLLPAAPPSIAGPRRRGALSARRRRPGRRLVRHLHPAQRQSRFRDGRCRGAWPPVGGRHGPAAQRTTCLRPRSRRPGRGAAPPRSQTLLLRERHHGHRRVRGHRTALRLRDDLQRRPPGTVDRPAGATVRRDRQCLGAACCWGSIPSSNATARRSRSHRGLPSRSTPTGWSSAEEGPTSTRTQTSNAWSSYDERSWPATTLKRPAVGSSPEGLGDDSVEDDVALVVVRRPA